jgi:hypothetical protein
MEKRAVMSAVGMKGILIAVMRENGKGNQLQKLPNWRPYLSPGTKQDSNKPASPETAAAIWCAIGGKLRSILPS